MPRQILALGLSLLLHATLCAAELPPAVEKPIDFEKDVQTILTAKCHDCHGESSQEGGFRLDRKASVLRGGDSGEPAIVVGDSAKSHLIRLVAGLEADLRMPPEKDDALTTEQIGVLRAWIDQGATWPGPGGAMEATKPTSDHWAFQPIQPVEVPAVESDWGNNSIDQFILAKLKEQNLTPNSVADRRTLIRRLALDLTGLPPTPQEVDAYVTDQSADATDKLIERLLASPHFGERWASYWLDLVRFAETHGFETNRERPNAWRYRDYVIQAFNDDKPFDQFIREQIAGDSFGNSIGLSYLVAGPYDLVKSPDINLTLMQRQNELDDMVNTTGTAFMGLTLGCARCHNHKFDPILQSDYYSMQAIFAGVKHADMALPLTAEQTARAQTLRREVAQLESELSGYLHRQSGDRFVLIDDNPELAGASVRRLQDIAGKGVNPPGERVGQANFPGDAKRSPNVSGGQYTWWKLRPNEPAMAWLPKVAGTYRVWLSWGSGHETHCQDAKYVIDRDGDAATKDDWEVIAVVNQQQLADGESSAKAQSLWSGFYDAKVVDFDADDQLLLVGGTTGTALTADVVLFEEVSDAQGTAPAKPIFREMVAAEGNVENLTPRLARFVRFTIDATNGGSEPCLDELEIFSAGQNVALAQHGGKAVASGTLAGHAIHKLEHINDGQYSNNRSWISATPGSGWVQIELSEPYEIDRIVWSRDRDGRYADRLATQYRIEVSLDGVHWEVAANSSDRLPLDANPAKATYSYRFDHLSAAEAEAAQAMLAKLQRSQKELESVTQPAAAYAGQYQQPAPTHRLYRGEPLEKREEVSPDAPAIFTHLPLTTNSPEQERRKQLAEWIASPNNPLTARVIVNRLWQFHFGAGLVDTPSDFGSAGIPPTHPELLDWLAGELIQHDWSLKHIHRLILQSAAYQQSSRPNPAGLQVDGGASLLWRYPPHRLEAEPIRDSILSVSGVLDLKMGGPGFSAFEVEAENVRHYHPKSSFGPDDWRRMVYMTKVRMEKDAVFGLFDCPDAATTVAKRSRSTTPLQALNLFNSKFLLQQADLFRQRLESEADGIDDQITLAYQLCYARAPREQELAHCRQFVQQQGLHAFCRVLLNSNEFLFLQ